MQTRYLQLVDLFERPASKAASYALGLNSKSCASGSCGGAGGKHGFGAARLLMSRARACGGVDRRLARFLFGPQRQTNTPRDLQLRGKYRISRGLRPAGHLLRAVLPVQDRSNGRNRCSVRRKKKARERPMAEQRAADHTKRQPAPLVWVVVVPTGLPKLLYRKLHPRAVQKTLDGRVI